MSEVRKPSDLSRAMEYDVWRSGLINLCHAGPEGQLWNCSAGFMNLVRGVENNGRPDSLPGLIHPEDRPAFMEDLQRLCLDGQDMSRRQVRLVLPDGRVILLEAAGEPCRGPAGEDGALLAFWEGLAEVSGESWGAGEEETFQEEIKDFINSLFQPVLLLNTEARIIHANTAVQELLGFRKFELIGSPVATLFERRKDHLPKALIRFARLMQTGQMQELPYQWQAKDGQKIPVTMSGSVIRSRSGELVGMAVVARDERKNALLADLEKHNLELMRALDELKRMDQMKDDLLSLVGHELRAPLANILGYAEFLNEWDLSAQEKKDFTRIIYQESQRLSRLVNDILDLSRMEAGRVVYNYVRDSINRVVQTAVDGLRADAEIKNLKIILKLDDQLEPMEFDPDRIQQVVTNILNNAIKFTEKNKAITVQTEAVEAGVRVSIADQGVGINPEDAVRVFAKFEQVGEVAHHSLGAGLGMPIAKQIVEEGHGGTIWFDSQGVGHGAVFRFILPERRPAS